MADKSKQIWRNHVLQKKIANTDKYWHTQAGVHAHTQHNTVINASNLVFTEASMLPGTILSAHCPLRAHCTWFYFLFFQKLLIHLEDSMLSSNEVTTPVSYSYTKKFLELAQRHGYIALPVSEYTLLPRRGRGGSKMWCGRDYCVFPWNSKIGRWLLIQDVIFCFSLLFLYRQLVLANLPTPKRISITVSLHYLFKIILHKQSTPGESSWNRSIKVSKIAQ